MKFKGKERFLVMLMAACFMSSYGLTAQTIDQQAQEILSKMTLEEKATIVVGTGMMGASGSNGAVGRTIGKVNGAAGTTGALSRFGLPQIIMADGTSGVRIDPTRPDDPKSYYGTSFPVGTLIASSWDRAIAEKVGRAIGSEAKEYGIDIMLAPGINIQRNPLGGRNFEYYSEDPLVSGILGASFVNGMQGAGVGASVKHFAANNQETNRNSSNSLVSERALREIYLRSFQVLLEHSRPWTIMSTYNKLNGTYTSENKELLTNILRDEWGYDGLVMTDWFGGKNAVQQMIAGNDLIMPGGESKAKTIIKAVESGMLDSKILDQNVLRILKVVLQSASYKKYPFKSTPDLEQNAKVSLEAAEQGMVLLKNKACLPLASGVKIALFGNNSYDLIEGGGGSSEVNEKHIINIDKGLENNGFQIQGDLAQTVRAYIQEEKQKLPQRQSLLEVPKQIKPMAYSESMISNAVKQSDIAVLTIGRTGGEAHDRKPDFDFYLTPEEKNTLNQIATAFHAAGKKVVVVLNIDSVIDVASWNDNVDAILVAWQPGMEGGQAVANILSGVINPSGKTAITFPVKYEDVPSSATFPNGKDEKQVDMIYNEGIYVGYRYYDSFKVKPAYCFGYGLSYTSFSYESAKISEKVLKDSIAVRVTVTNTGSVAGREIVQLYISAPSKDLKKASKELKGFSKTKLLQSGEKETLTFHIHIRDLASFDPIKSAWITETGKYKIQLQPSSDSKGLESSFSIKKEFVKKVRHNLVPPRQFKELEYEK